MIIKKKKLNKVSGNVPEEVLQTDDTAVQDFAVPENDGIPQVDGGQEFENTTADYEQSPLTEAENQSPAAEVQTPAVPVEPEPEDIDLFSLDNIDFTQREERRKGDRRRGFRRVDDRNLVSRAREEADSIREAARNEGYQAGLEQAQAEIQQVKEAFEMFMGAPQAVYEQIAPDIMQISVDIAQKIIKKETEEDPQVLINTIIDVLKGLSKEENKISLRVNPVQVDVIKQQIPEILNIAGLDAKVSVLADEEVTEGGCLVTTANGIVDATIETQLSIIYEALKEV